MKKFLGFFFVIVFMLTLPYFSADSLAAKGGWKKYCDFEEYPIGPLVKDEKWSFNDNSDVADISIADYNGSRQVKFTYKNGSPVTNESCYLFFNKCPETIVGIKVDVTIASCDGNQDCRGRVAWHRGSTPSDHYYIWEAIQVRPNRRSHNQGYLSAQASINDQNNDWEWIGNIFWTNFENWIETIGRTFTVSTIFDKPDQVTVSVDGQGTSTFKFKNKIENPVEIFKALGMRVQEGTDWDGNPRIVNGNFVVYFDNVYIRTKGKCDKKGPVAKKVNPKNKVPLDTCWLSITFDEPMKCCTWDVQGNVDWPIDASTKTMWSDDRRTFSISRNNCGSKLPGNKVLEFIINPNGDTVQYYFKDLKGNAAKTKKIIIKTLKTKK